MKKPGMVAGLFSAVIATPGLSQTALSDPASWITAQDYPREFGDQGGSANVRFDISPRGRVENCESVYSSPEAMGEIVCAILVARARYEPAYDTGGNPVSSEGVHQVNWADVGEAHALTPFQGYGGATPRNDTSSWIGYEDVPVWLGGAQGGAGEIPLAFGVSAEGRLEDCRAGDREAPDRAVRHFCNLLERRARFDAPIGRDGHVYATEGSIRIVWSVGQATR